MPEEHQRELGEVALKAWRQLQHLIPIVQGFAAIDPADEAVRCVSCAGVAEPSEWTKWGGPPGNPDPPAPEMVFVASNARRWHGFWHEPDCPWLLAWKQFHD